MTALTAIGMAVLTALAGVIGGLALSRWKRRR
jgi:predicted CDP-diglyceride synthetase/phosphatidate cytidylyltransferase